MKGFKQEDIKLEDAGHRILYWTGAQTVLINAIKETLEECKQAIPQRYPNEPHFKFSVYLFCDVLIPDDADCTIDVNKHPKFPKVPVFEIHVCMGLRRWVDEFRWGATLMLRQVFRSALPDEEVLLSDSYAITPFKDHVNVTGLQGKFEKTDNYK